MGLEKKNTTVAAEDDRGVPAADHHGVITAFQADSAKGVAASSLSHISEAEVAAFLPPFCDLAS